MTSVYLQPRLTSNNSPYTTDNSSRLCTVPRINGGLTSLRGNVQAGTTLTITCYPGYELQGPEKIQCLGNDKFDSAPGEGVDITKGLGLIPVYYKGYSPERVFYRAITS